MEHIQVKRDRIYSMKSLQAYLRKRESERGEGTLASLEDGFFINKELSEQLILKRSRSLFKKSGHSVMVTMDKSMDESDIAGLLESGMDLARINCGHDGVQEWKEIIRRIRLASEMAEVQPCKIYMDLSGPKIRITSLPNQLPYIKVQADEMIQISLKEDLKEVGEKGGLFTTNMPKAFRNAKKGDRLLINDGKVQGTVVYKSDEVIAARLHHHLKKSFSIKVNDGINLPDSLSFLLLPAMSEKDIRESSFIFKHADIVGLSFVHTKKDLQFLKNLMLQKIGKILPIAAKIETEYAVKNLPSILSEGLKHEGFGIMAARGDLAVEGGFEKLGRLQDEIISLCHHSQTPLIYATEVLGTFAKTGLPSRPEVIDAHLSFSAACTMLNKGAYIQNAVRMLKRIGAEQKVKLTFISSDLLEE
ncbi:pyruvate kinase [Bacillus sp. FJAT-42376]|uniref:pyruvate kinase n=1 Tax=Bacillus sp. FJAT-42376 TaxID=2014076 RepID=UPI0013DDFFE9|nr:pyruvate kinase [Bacillus sp. FJAT-42376]